MPSRPELYANKQNFRAAQIDAAMKGKQPPTKAEWEKSQKENKKS
jgi:hypothetical protein